MSFQHSPGWIELEIIDVEEVLAKGTVGSIGIALQALLLLRARLRTESREILDLGEKVSGFEKRNAYGYPIS